MFQPGSVIAGRYQVVRLVGQGGMSNLYLCYDRKYSNATVVIKEMTASYSDPKEQQMAVDLFHREAKLLASLNHRHIPKVYDYFQYAGKYYLSMEFIDGIDLAQKLEATKGPLPEQQVLEWGEQIATVLFYLHKHDPPIVFRDVKPSNIMLCDQGVKLIDFGIARHFDQAKKGDTMRIGSPGYAPPEQYAAQTDPRSDIYALGVTLHHALTGRDPTATQTPFLVPPAKKINPALGEATSAMLARATQLDPSDRYQSVLDMKKDIQQILSRGKQSTRVVGAPPTPPAPPSPPAQAAQSSTSQQPPSTPPAASPAAPPSATAAAAAGASPPVGPHQPASGSLVAASAPATSSAPLPSSSGTGPVTSGSAPAPKKSGQLWLLVAAMMMVLGAGIAFIGPEQRQTLWTGLTEQVTQLAERFSKGQDGSRQLQQALVLGDPDQLLGALRSPKLEALSPEEERLYRLNLLALEAGDNQKRLVHLLYPESAIGTGLEKEIFESVSAALSALNGIGGSDRTLLLCSPQTYRVEQLQEELHRIRSQDGVESSSIVVLRLPEQTSGPEGQPKDGSEEPAVEQHPDVATLFLDRETGRLLLPNQSIELPLSLQELVRQSRESASLDGLHWGGLESTLAETQPPPTRLRPDALSSLSRQTTEQGERLLIESFRLPQPVPELGGAKLLLFAVSPFELPILSPETDAEALVLWDPLQRQLSVPAASESLSLGLTGALLRDLLILQGSAQNYRSYQGLVLAGAPGALSWSPTTTNYRWIDQTWLPNTPQKDESQ